MVNEEDECAMPEIEPKDALEAFGKARKLDKRARAARARSYHRTGGTATATAEWDKADTYLERADEQWEIVHEFLMQECGQ
jgi:hypothetical protein